MLLAVPMHSVQLTPGNTVYRGLIPRLSEVASTCQGKSRGSTNCECGEWSKHDRDKKESTAWHKAWSSTIFTESNMDKQFSEQIDHNVDSPPKNEAEYSAIESRYSHEEQRHIIHKVDRRLVTALGLLLCVSLIDRTNLGGAMISGYCFTPIWVALMLT